MERERCQIGASYWIQNVDRSDGFIAQIASCEEAGLWFGDTGNLYILADIGEVMTAFIQCY
jgi:hypothetical protein